MAVLPSWGAVLAELSRRLGAASIRRNVHERVTFLRSFLAHPRQVGAVLPTSRRAVRDMLDLADFTQVRCVVEFGAGTGVYTGEILDRLPAGARLLAFEVDTGLADVLRSRCDDSRLRVLTDSAANVDAYLDGEPVDIVVSGLPFTSLPAELGRTILDRAAQSLRPGGVMLVLQYSPFIRQQLSAVFSSVRWRLSPLNLPPAFLFACRSDVHNHAGGAR